MDSKNKWAAVQAAASAGNVLGIENLVTVAVNAIVVAQDVDGQLDDGFQPFTDIPAIAFKDFGKLQAIAAVAPAALRELGDLTPDEVDEFEARVSSATSLPSTGLIGKGRRVIRYAAKVYRETLEIGDLFQEGKELFGSLRA
jgi:hypothetical protein